MRLEGTDGIMMQQTKVTIAAGSPAGTGKTWSNISRYVSQNGTPAGIHDSPNIHEGDETDHGRSSAPTAIFGQQPLDPC
jgi:hypothetical protein